jgi:hypothetical protein
VLRRALLTALAASLCAARAAAQDGPRVYTAVRTRHTPAIDGRLDDAAWSNVPWSEPFTDIEGARQPAPRFRTRIKMLWDDTNLYVAAELEEPDVWGTITQRDAVIFRDNDFEVFVDPDGDARQYAELEINALNTVWDLFLETPYRDGGHADDAWDIAGLRTATAVMGTLNHSGDRDVGWTVEMAIPWAGLARASHTSTAPRAGDTWRINFSRVEWDVDISAGSYRKVPGRSEHNWVWSPQGMVDMHQPEMWGMVRFRGDTIPPPEPDVMRKQIAVTAGYAGRLDGAVLAYHSSHPEADTALLVRANREVGEIRWQTDTVPSAGAPTFAWVAGLSGGKGVHRFELLVNNRSCFTFQSSLDSTVRDWTVPGCGGTLRFHAIMADRYSDLFGWMWLELPAGATTPGTPLTLEVRGENANSDAWYMTFMYRLALHPRLRQDPVLVKTDSGEQTQLRVVLDNPGQPRIAEVRVEGGGRLQRGSDFGGTVMLVPAGPPHEGRVTVRLGDSLLLDTLVQTLRVTRRDVYVLSYSHNDIGYSAPQDSVLHTQWRWLDQALDLVDRTRGYPDDARFRWNVEMLWPIGGWLARAGVAQRERFVRDVRDGSIALNGFLGGLESGLATSDELDHAFDAARRLRARDSLPVTTALVDDIPGFTWGAVPALARAGIHWLAMGPNPSDRIGAFLATWGDRPFWWRSQNGRDSVLTWVAGASYASFHMARMGVQGERTLYSLMRRLDVQRYPFRQVQLPYTVDGDNGPPDAGLPDFVRAWNERYASPHLIIATHPRMFADLVSDTSAHVPSHSGDMIDSWEDGAGSTALETAMARHAADALAQVEVLWQMGMGSPQRVAADSAWSDVVMWDEHTWGAAASIASPDDPEVRAQWAYKRRFAVEADSVARALLAATLESGSPPAAGFEVVNTADWPRTDLVLVQRAISGAGDRVLDDRGRAVPSQRLASGELALLAGDVPARSSRRYRVVRGRPLAARAAPLVIGFDTVTGAIAHLSWHGGPELVDRAQRSGLAAYLHVAGQDSAAAAGVRGTHIQRVDSGPLVSTWEIAADSVPGTNVMRMTVRAVPALGVVDVVLTIGKTAVRSKEAVHIAFPFTLPGAQPRFDVASAIVRPDSDQLEGTARYVLTAQSFVDLSNPERGVTVATPDAPLVEIGGMFAEQLGLRHLPVNSSFYSYVMNNYWHTNFKADQAGLATFRYVIRPHGTWDPDQAERFGMGVRRPLLVRSR